MNFKVVGESAFLTGQDEDRSSFGLINDKIYPEPYVCYYSDVNNGMLPFALTEKGIQVPFVDEHNNSTMKFLTYKELVNLVK